MVFLTCADAHICDDEARRHRLATARLFFFFRSIQTGRENWSCLLSHNIAYLTKNVCKCFVALY